MPEPVNTDGNHFYLSHSVCKRSLQLPNVYHLMPKNNDNYFKCNILPFASTKVRTSVPIYVIQGNISSKRRDYSILKAILDNYYNYDFKIKILGHGKLDNEFDKHKDKLILKYNLNFIDYHKEFADVYAIIPLISKSNNSLYYKGKLTSSINYGLAYNLKFIVDNELHKIYNLDNSFIYEDGNTKSLIHNFRKSLRAFYKNNEVLISTNNEALVNIS